MKKIERVVKELSDLYDFYEKIKGYTLREAPAASVGPRHDQTAPAGKGHGRKKRAVAP